MVADRIAVTSRRAGSAETTGVALRGAAPASTSRRRARAGRPRSRRHRDRAAPPKEDAKRYPEHEIERIVHTYSDHILFLISSGQGARAKAPKVKGSGECGEPKQINKASAIWQRPEIRAPARRSTQAYHSIAGAFDDPAMTLHYRAEGRQSYAVLLFASRAPFDLFDPSRKGRVKLYVRRVFITDDAELLPPWLRFVRGVVDSEDLPLNISREMLQNNPQVAQMRKALTGRVIGELENLAKEEKPETYGKIWEAFGAVIKEGLYEDHERREALLALTRFTTTTGTLRSLKQYVADLKPNQTEIYYLSGESLDRLKSNPKLEAARARGIEVLLLTDPVDAFWTSAPLDFGGSSVAEPGTSISGWSRLSIRRPSRRRPTRTPSSKPSRRRWPSRPA
jgi:molecular chaperone HtpG